MQGQMISKKSETSMYKFLIGLMFTAILVMVAIGIISTFTRSHTEERKLVDYWAEQISNLAEGRFTQLLYPDAIHKDVVFGFFSANAEDKPTRRSCNRGCVCAYNIDRNRLVHCASIRIEEIHMRRSLFPSSDPGTRLEIGNAYWIVRRPTNSFLVEFEFNGERESAFHGRSFFVIKKNNAIELNCNDVNQYCAKPLTEAQARDRQHPIQWT